jgi:hypothetical protein
MHMSENCESIRPLAIGAIRALIVEASKGDTPVTVDRLQKCLPLLQWLSRRAHGRAPVGELPDELRDPDTLTIADEDRLIEFGNRNYCTISSRIEFLPGWDFQSVACPTPGKDFIRWGNKPMAVILEEFSEHDDQCDHPDIRWHVALTKPVTLALAKNVTGRDRDAQPKSAKRRKKGNEKWRQAMQRMLDLRGKGKLPSTLRQAAKLLKSESFGYNTVRHAARQSTVLRSHFNPRNGTESPQSSGSAILTELAQQADVNTKEFIETLTPESRRDVEERLAGMPLDCAAELIETLAINPDAGRTGDVHLRENADQDSRTG